MAVDLLSMQTEFAINGNSRLRDFYANGARGTSTSAFHVSPGYGIPATNSAGATAPIPVDTASGARPQIDMLMFDGVSSYPPFATVFTPHVNDANTFASTDMKITPGVKQGTDLQGNSRTIANGKAIYGFTNNSPFYGPTTPIGSITSPTMPSGQFIFELTLIPVSSVSQPGGQLELRLRVSGNVSNSNSTFKSFYLNGMQFPRSRSTFDGYNQSGAGTTQWRWFSSNTPTVPGAARFSNPFVDASNNLLSASYPVWSTTLP